ncbi:hypothetical protein AEAC466_17320 [Asticcacaulis sp. AC466]|nr:hypothetical protein AEAC466_17320 [Asticcacaulis sp. AC466]
MGKSAVSNWKKAGLLVFVADPLNPGKQLIDAEKTDILINGSIDQTRGRPPTAIAQGGTSAGQALPETPEPKKPAYISPMEAARLEEMQERVMRRQLERAQLTGQLVDLAEYSMRMANMARLVRERTIGVIRTNAEALAEEPDPRAITALLTDVFDKMFAQVAAEIDQEADQEAQFDSDLIDVETLEDLELGPEEDETP